MDAYVLVQIQVGQAARATHEITKLPGVVGAEPVTGPYDVVIRITGPDLITLNATVVAGIHEIEGVTRTVTCPIVAHAARVDRPLLVAATA
jgi:DNA-binding Lrp family transcriptional regulator